MKRNELMTRLRQGAVIYGVSIGLAIALILLVLGLFGYDVVRAFRGLFFTSFRSAFGFQETIKKAIPLIFTTYAFTIPFMIKFFNIGGWGQMLFGGTVVTVVGLVLAPVGLPAVVMIPLLIIVGMAAGALIAGVAGYLKAYHDINPIISTIMLNFVAFYFVNFVATAGPFKDPTEGHPITIPLPASATLGFWWGIPQSVLVALLAVVFVYALLDRTRLGYEIRAVGHNQEAAETYGINFRRTILLTFALGGALGGLAGTFEVINIHGKLIEGFAKTSGAQYGILGILTSLLVAGNPAAVPVAAFFMSVLLVGADSLQRTMQVPVEMVFVSQAVIVLTIVVLRGRMSRARDARSK